MWRSLIAVAGPGDVIVAKTDPPLLSVLAMPAAKRRGAHLINWLQDLYPEIAVQLGVPFLRGPIVQSISYLRDRSLRAAAANVTVGHGMAERLLARGVASERVHVIPNWSDDDEITPISRATNPLRQNRELADKFVVGYSGNLGRAHEFHTVVAAAERLRDHADIVFVFIGGGHRLDELTRRVDERCLKQSFRFFPYQDRASLKYSLSVPDVHWISLKPEVEGLMVPSKFYGIAAAGRPIIAITAKDGEIARLVEEHACGLVIEPGNAGALADALLALSSDTPRLSAMGGRARAMLDAHFTRRQAFERWVQVIENVEKSATPRDV